jgi:plastocyanin
LLFDVVGEINLQGTKIVRLLDPTNAQDAATKKYVDENTLTSFGIGADDSTIRNVGPGESIKIIGGTNVTTASDAEGNITINSSGSSSNSFETIVVSGQNNVVAESSTDTLTLVAGTDISITTNNSSDTVTINSTASGGASNLTQLTDVSLSSVETGQMLVYNGSNWVNANGPSYRYEFNAVDASNYQVGGPGLTGTPNDPDLYFRRGNTYYLDNSGTGGAHPLLIKTTAGTGTGNQYTTGVSGSANGVIIFEVPFGAPSTLYYQCQFHGGMVGQINIS